MPLLPFAALAGLVLLQRSASSLREAFVRGAVVWGATLVAITELLSLFDSLTAPAIAGAWAGVTILALAAWLWLGRPNVVRIPVRWPRDAAGRAELAVIGVVLAITLGLALVAAPATWDALVYHLSRVEHWIQNGNVKPYPTQIPRQLWPGPGAEFVILHLRVLAGTDRVITVVQWLAFAGNIVVASLLAAQLGAGRKGQLFASFLTATLPGAVAQATGAQVELVFAFWLACSVSLVLQLRAREADRQTPADALLLGAAIGLAILTKALAYLYLMPFMLWLLVVLVRQNPLRAARTFALAGLVALALTAPQYRRNLIVFSSALGQPGADGVVNTSFSFRGLASNMIRNTVLHFGTRSSRVNDLIYKSVLLLHTGLGIGANDTATTFAPFVPIRLEAGEENASCPLQVLLFIGASIGLAFAGVRRHRPQLLFSLSIVGGFLVFCFYLRWQPWHARLHVPLLILATAFCGYAIERVRWRWAIPLTMVAVIAGVLPALLVNPTRPLLLHQPVFSVPRDRQYFAANPEWYWPYRGAVDYLHRAGCRNVGLKIGGNDFEYALWALLEERFGARPHIRHVQVTTESARGPATRQETFTPCAIVYIHSAPRQKPFVVPPDYKLGWQQDSVRVFLRLSVSDQP